MYVKNVEMKSLIYKDHQLYICMSNFESTKVIELGSCAFRQWRATHSHCQLCHGYQLKAKFWFGGSQLDEKQWLVDFGGLKELKAILQDTFDHTWCVAADDPCLPIIKQLEQAGAAKLRIFENGVGIERAAEFCYKTASEFIKIKYEGRCWVNKVEVFEHADNSAVYSQPRTQPDVSMPDIWTHNTVEQKIAMLKINELSAGTITGDVIDTIAAGNVSHIDVTPLEVPIVHNTRAAQVGPNTSSNKNDWFKGTSWGNK